MFLLSSWPVDPRSRCRAVFEKILQHFQPAIKTVDKFWISFDVRQFESMYERIVLVTLYQSHMESTSIYVTGALYIQAKLRSASFDSQWSNRRKIVQWWSVGAVGIWATRPESVSMKLSVLCAATEATLSTTAECLTPTRQKVKNIPVHSQ